MGLGPKSSRGLDLNRRVLGDRRCQTLWIDSRVLISTSPLTFSLLTGKHSALSDPVQVVGSIVLQRYWSILMQPIHSR
jgi:hypothetical protein